jgi:hypothetical protein
VPARQARFLAQFCDDAEEWWSFDHSSASSPGVLPAKIWAAGLGQSSLGLALKLLADCLNYGAGHDFAAQ